jgi:hypothetical protein
VTPPRRRREGLERRFEATDFFNLDEHPPDMDEVLDVFELDLGELVEGGFQLLVAGLLLVVGVVLMVAELLVDGTFLWGAVLFVLGIIAGLFAAVSFLDVFF